MVILKAFQQSDSKVMHHNVAPLCYGRPLLQAWLLPDLNKIPELSGYGIDFWMQEVTCSSPVPYIFAMHLFICFFVMDFVCKMGVSLGLVKEPLIPFNIQKMDFLSNICL